MSPKGLVPTARAVVRGELDAAKLPKATQRQVARIRAAIGDDVLKHDPKPRATIHAVGAPVRQARTA